MKRILALVLLAALCIALPAVALGAEKYVDVATVSNGEYKKNYTSLAQALVDISKQPAGYTLTLLQDVTLQKETLNISSGNFAIDLNTHTLQAPFTVFSITGGTITISNGKIRTLQNTEEVAVLMDSGSDNYDKSMLWLKNCTIEGTRDAACVVLVEHGRLGLEDCTLDGNTVGVGAGIVEQSYTHTEAAIILKGNNHLSRMNRFQNAMHVDLTEHAGGELYIYNRDIDMQVMLAGDVVTLGADYSWYDEYGNPIHAGMEIYPGRGFYVRITPMATATYKRSNDSQDFSTDRFVLDERYELKPCMFDPLDDGSRFAGWRYDDAIYQPYTTLRLSGDVTLTAEWESIPVEDIAGVPKYLRYDDEFELKKATVLPDNAKSKTIKWTLEEGETVAVLEDDVLKAGEETGTLTLIATIEDGVAVGQAFEKEFEIEVSEEPGPYVASVSYAVQSQESFTELKDAIDFVVDLFDRNDEEELGNVVLTLLKDAELNPDDPSELFERIEMNNIACTFELGGNTISGRFVFLLDNSIITFNDGRFSPVLQRHNSPDGPSALIVAKNQSDVVLQNVQLVSPYDCGVVVAEKSRLTIDDSSITGGRCAVESTGDGTITNMIGDGALSCGQAMFAWQGGEINLAQATGGRYTIYNNTPNMDMPLSAISLSTPYGYFDKDGYPIPETASIQPDRTVTVRKKDMRTISFGSGGAKGSMAPVNVQYETMYTLPKDHKFEILGAALMGWDIDGVFYKPGDAYGPVVRDVTADAVWKNEKRIRITGEADNSAHGRVSGTGYYNEGDIAVLNAIPNEGHDCRYHFKEWKEDKTSRSAANPYSFEVDAPRTLTADFTKQYYITAGVLEGDGRGRVTGGGWQDENMPVELTAKPAFGCVFVEWQNENYQSLSCENPYNITADRAYIVYARFAREQCSISVQALPPQGGKAAGGGAVNMGDEVTVTAVPNPGYRFAGWMENDRMVSTAAEYTFTALDDRQLTAVFEVSGDAVPLTGDHQHPTLWMALCLLSLCGLAMGLRRRKEQA